MFSQQTGVAKRIFLGLFELARNESSDNPRPHPKKFSLVSLDQRNELQVAPH